MKITYLDKKGNTHLIEEISYLEDDDEIIKMLINEKSFAVHKADIIERTYSVVM